MAIEPLIGFIKGGGGEAIGLIAATGFSVIGIILLVLGIIFLLAWLAVGIGGVVLWIWMMVDCIQRKFKSKSEKIMWLIVLIATIFGTGMLLHILSAIIYNFAVRKKSKFSVKRKFKRK